MKQHLAAALITVAAVATLAVPAGAAVPKRTPSDTIECGPKQASVWFEGKHLAAKNPCTQWLNLVIEYETPDNGIDTTLVSVAPGAHFNVRLAKLDLPVGDTDYESAELAPWAAGCVGFLKNSKGKPSDLCE